MRKTLPLLETESEEIGAQLPYWSGISDISEMIWHIGFNILISVYYVNWHLVLVLQIGLFEFVSLDGKAWRAIALFLIQPTLNRSLQSILLDSIDTDIRKWLVYTLFRISEWHHTTLLWCFHLWPWISQFLFFAWIARVSSGTSGTTRDGEASLRLTFLCVLALNSLFY